MSADNTAAIRSCFDEIKQVLGGRVDAVEHIQSQHHEWLEGHEYQIEVLEEKVRSMELERAEWAKELQAIKARVEQAVTAEPPTLGGNAFDRNPDPAVLKLTTQGGSSTLKARSQKDLGHSP